MSTFFATQEGPVNALALNRDYTQVAIGGRNVFKVYAIEDDKFREICNVRGSKHLNSGFSCNDVTWSPIDDHYLATAATNGHVSVWNLTKMGKAMQEQDYLDHRRTVNKVNFHASEPYKLISGSQDGTMRYFDVRMASAVTVFYSNTESVRDVQFSPHNPHTFSAVSDNGSVQLWDIRKPEKCQQQYTAHSGPVFACDWHPEMTWLATASRDKTIKVWDLTSKPTLEYTIHTIASIGRVKWRPQRKFHIASCALVIDCSINVWDVRRPYIPFAAFNEHRDIASSIAWRGDPHLFLSSGRDCTLYQHSFNDASRPASKANPQGISMNRQGEILFARKVSIIHNAATSNTNNSSLAKATAGLMRKISTTQTVDQFHHASSVLQQFTSFNQIESQKSNVFLCLAKKYVLSGRTVSELCEHNSAVALEFGKHQLAVIWKLIKTMYGEEFIQNSININSSRDDVSHNNSHNTNSNMVAMENKVNNIQKLEIEQKPKGGGEIHIAQFPIADENNDEVDHITNYNNGFPAYLNFQTGLPKGDFSFGENELDMELESMNSAFSGFHSSYRNSFKMDPDFRDWVLPNEAFPIRHEITDRSPQPEHFPNHHSPDITEEPQTFHVEEQSSGLISVSRPLKKVSWDPSLIVIEALQYHATLGDIQTAACVLIVLGDCRKYLKTLNEAVQEHWLLGYIDMLRRHRAWNAATKVIKLAWLPSVHQMNQQSTRINSNCGQCGKPLQRAGWLCDRCHSVTHGLCSICKQVAKGLYVWCRGCSHGGHVAHIRQWCAAGNTSCPTGCGHICQYT